MKIDDIEFEFDILELGTAKRYESALTKVQDTKTPTDSLAGIIEQQCGSVFAFFDELFGEGTSKRLFGDRVNLSLCMDALRCVIAEFDEQKSRYIAKSSAYAPNRASRRAQQSAK